MAQNIKRITTPLTEQAVKDLRAGDSVFITGEIYTGRDAAHNRFAKLIELGNELPVDFAGQIIYYVGPTPARPGQACGAAGPTTSCRMDINTPPLLERGLKGMIGKGLRSQAVIDSMKKNKAVYFAATGGAAALIAGSIKKVEVIAYGDLGAEALHKMTVEDFPAIVVVDSQGNNLYRTGPEQFRR
jgi:fumarate hydratase subunit beta